MRNEINVMVYFKPGESSQQKSFSQEIKINF